MHPPLHREHPDCLDVIEALKKCHAEHNIGKFFGLCNDAKAKLDRCFRAEKEKVRNANYLKALEFEKKYEERKKAAGIIKNNNND